MEHEKLVAYHLLAENPKWLKVMKEAFEAEKNYHKKFPKAQYPDMEWLGFEWHQVHCIPSVLSKMVDASLLDITFSSNASKNYKIANPEMIKVVMSQIDEWKESLNVKETVEIPDNVFDSIVGYDDIKENLLKALRLEKRIHFLFESPPAVGAKSTFMLCIEQAFSGSAYFATGSKVRPGGLTEVLMSNPAVLILDEIDKLDSRDYSVILSSMESGIVLETKYRRHTRTEVNTVVVAACNSASKLPPELLSRFDFHLKLKPYTKDEFISVCKSFLAQFEKVQEDLAEYIGIRVWDSIKIPSDPRKARGIARMLDKYDMKLGKQEVDKLVSFEEKYG